MRKKKFSKCNENEIIALTESKKLNGMERYTKQTVEQQNKNNIEIA
jgi:hypothetical protein